MNQINYFHPFLHCFLPINHRRRVYYISSNTSCALQTSDHQIHFQYVTSAPNNEQQHLEVVT